MKKTEFSMPNDEVTEAWHVALVLLFIYIDMSFAGLEVHIVRNCDRGLENAARGRSL